MVSLSTNIPDLDNDLAECVAVISILVDTLAAEVDGMPDWCQESARRLITMAAMDVECLLDVHFSRHSQD